MLPKAAFKTDFKPLLEKIIQCLVLTHYQEMKRNKINQKKNKPNKKETAITLNNFFNEIPRNY